MLSFSFCYTDQPRTTLYQLGIHLDDCECCQHLYPPPWIPATPCDFDPNLECLASRIMMAKPFYVSQDHGR
ncbi:hypothetical protein RHMOL_Rhmol05G0221700 [Rhododendron molle]|uniref:Uncharacterized protein n=1 Tax=Rhododendron molle TaxID=49168 RepID=A0ACC0NSS2_RHOML|nr:hypothetical protein RHMOL_Rhmol05G0221700 [Rhododendron molle]